MPLSLETFPAGPHIEREQSISLGYRAKRSVNDECLLFGDGIIEKIGVKLGQARPMVRDQHGIVYSTHTNYATSSSTFGPI